MIRVNLSTTSLRAIAFVLSVSAWGLSACSEDHGPHRYTRFSMGTVVEYVIVGVEPDVARSAVEEAQAEMERVASLLWDEDVSSETFRINTSCESDMTGAACNGVPISDETSRFLSRSLSYHIETDGAFDVTVGSFLRFYDFGSDSAAVPDTLEIRRIADLYREGGRDFQVGPSELTGLRSRVRIAVGGVAKGYAVDRAVQVLREAGVRSALVNAGGDLYCLGTNNGDPWRVGIQDPNPSETGQVSVLTAVEVVDAAVATSGDYQRYFEAGGIRYHHLLDPATGLPARRARSATVIATSTERADALATGLFVAGLDGLQLIDAAPDTEALLVDAQGRRHETRGMGELRATTGRLSSDGLDEEPDED